MALDLNNQKMPTNQLKQRARSLRKNSTRAENRLWYFLRNRNLFGYKFMRQYVIPPYIVDFVCREKFLIVEIDGGQHCEQSWYDSKRTAYLEKIGFKVMRYWNNEVLRDPHIVLEEILAMLQGPSP
jgi:very-short-patch-repair endonuclease